MVEYDHCSLLFQLVGGPHIGIPLTIAQRNSRDRDLISD